MERLVIVLVLYEFDYMIVVSVDSVDTFQTIHFNGGDLKGNSTLPQISF